MLKIFRDLLRFNLEFAIGTLIVSIIVGLSILSFFSPYPPEDIYVVAPDVPPSWEYWLGTTSRASSPHLPSSISTPSIALRCIALRAS